MLTPALRIPFDDQLLRRSKESKNPGQVKSSSNYNLISPRISLSHGLIEAGRKWSEPLYNGYVVWSGQQYKIAYAASSDVGISRKDIK